MGFGVYIEVNGKAKDEVEAHRLAAALDGVLANFPNVGGRRSFPNSVRPTNVTFSEPGVENGAFWIYYEGRAFDDDSVMAVIRPVAEDFGVNLTVTITCDDYPGQAIYFAGPNQRSAEIGENLGHILDALNVLQAKRVTGQELTAALAFTPHTDLFTPDALERLVRDIENALR